MPGYLDWPLDGAPSTEEEYDRYAAVYDLLFGARGDDLEYYVRAAQELLPKGGDILELGTGTGRVAERLVEEGFRVVGVDFSRAMLERAKARQTSLEGRFEPVLGDVRKLDLGRKFPLIIAPFGMMAHLLDEEDRLATMTGVFEHLAPGGTFIFDDMPTWLAGPSKGDSLEVLREIPDPESGYIVRATTTAIDIATEPLTLCFHFLDWLEAGRLVKRISIRVLFRNTSIEDELRWLERTHFERIELHGGFDGRSFDRQTLSSNTRFIVRCHKPS